MELTPDYDARKSFYGKAIVNVDRSGAYAATLTSYGTPVSRVEWDENTLNYRVTLLEDWDCSQNTLRHVKEFLKQHCFKADSKAQMQRDYA